MAAFQGDQIEVPSPHNDRIVMYIPVNGASPTRSVLFTAPHTIPLCRDDNPYHSIEDYTLNLCKVFAKAVGGVGCTWTVQEQQRVQGLPAPDPVNRDPNYLTNAEARLDNNPWRSAMHLSQQLFRFDPAAIHIDLHGLNRERHEVDLCIGYGAAKRRFQWNEAEMSALETYIVTELNRYLPNIFVLTNQVPVQGQYTICFNQTPQGYELAGDWGADRNTMTQLSTNRNWGCHFKCALQLEMSKSLRKALNESSDFAAKFATAFASIRPPKP